jgi:hypothetical protein
MRIKAYRGRHRLGTPGLVHCALHPPVAVALITNRRSWLAALLVPARHSLAGLRRRALAPLTPTRTPDQAWSPTPA